MMTTANYIVTKDIAQRSGMIASRYRTEDGRFILNERDLARVRLTPEEYVSGLAGVEMITTEVAKTLIRQNNYQMGENAPIEPANDEGGITGQEEGETPAEGEETNNTEEEA